MKGHRFSEDMLDCANVMTQFSKNFPSIMETQREKIDAIYEMIENCSAIHVYGKGRSGAIAVCFSLRLSHFDFKPVFFLGDVIKMIFANNDLVFLLSGSGDTSEVVEVARKARKIGAKVVAITSYTESDLARNADLLVLLPGGMEKRKGWSYLEAQLNERPSFYGGGEFEFYSYLFQETLLSAIGSHRGIGGGIIAKTHERDEVLKE
ncbi:MAG: SIS domain-containing protein [Thaumarchaeota archaeon]|nr:SIS domain-containing protein [Nitrososphaerota archaeon]